jgi:hypothetical protein
MTAASWSAVVSVTRRSRKAFDFSWSRLRQATAPEELRCASGRRFLPTLTYRISRMRSYWKPLHSPEGIPRSMRNRAPARGMRMPVPCFFVNLSFAGGRVEVVASVATRTEPSLGYGCKPCEGRASRSCRSRSCWAFRCRVPRLCLAIPTRHAQCVSRDARREHDCDPRVDSTTCVVRCEDRLGPRVRGPGPYVCATAGVCGKHRHVDLRVRGGGAPPHGTERSSSGFLPPTHREVHVVPLPSANRRSMLSRV